MAQLTFPKIQTTQSTWSKGACKSQKDPSGLERIAPFDVYHVYKEANETWGSFILKYIAEDVGKQKFVIWNFNKWEMIDGKDIKL